MGVRVREIWVSRAWDMGVFLRTGEWAWKGAEWVRGTFGVYGGGFGEVLGNF